jgi:hypothetical protein
MWNIYPVEGTVASCIRCDDAPQVDAEGFCGHCHWAVRFEVENGLVAIGEYLRRWARYADWCVDHGRQP